MTDAKWMLEAVVRAIHTILLSEHGGAAGIRDKAMLQSALPKHRKNLPMNQKLIILISLLRTVLVCLETVVE